MFMLDNVFMSRKFIIFNIELILSNDLLPKGISHSQASIIEEHKSRKLLVENE